MMTWLTGIVIAACIAFGIIVARSLRYVPKERPNYEEKELTSTAFDYNPTPNRRATRFYIRDNGVIVKRELCQC